MAFGSTHLAMRNAIVPRKSGPDQAEEGLDAADYKYIRASLLQAVVEAHAATATLEKDMLVRDLVAHRAEYQKLARAARNAWRRVAGLALRRGIIDPDLKLEERMELALEQKGIDPFALESVANKAAAKRIAKDPTRRVRRRGPGKGAAD